mmetsp:Transcript_27083/g.70160  ORF Transcript_27083/g.70160 Transcript_27083/m.70160 type:complete len:83 (+) Transcript_27083:458-706(+)
MKRNIPVEKNPLQKNSENVIIGFTDAAAPPQETLGRRAPKVVTVAESNFKVKWVPHVVQLSAERRIINNSGVQSLLVVEAKD